MRTKKPLAAILVLALVLAGLWLEQRARREAAEGNAGLLEAIAGRRSKVWVSGEGRIVRLLPDDRNPPRHQVFLVAITPEHTIKIAHNVDLAPTVPVRTGETIRFRGRFEWNAKGGVVHWTHRDPQGRRPGGWLKYAGKTYE